MADKEINEPSKWKRVRWIILSLFFFMMTLNYWDRQNLGLLKEDYLVPLFGWSELDYANIVIAFQVAYAVGMLGIGYLIDKIGTKLGFAFTLVIWSLASFGNAMANGLIGFVVARGFLGFSQAGNLPSAVKSIGEWFPNRERALAAGVLSSGANLGAIIAPIVVPLIAISFGWRWAFVIPGVICSICIVLWFLFYEKPASHKRVSNQEYQYIHSDANEAHERDQVGKRVKWYTLLSYKQTWAFAALKFFTDPVWWFLMFWLPSFLNKEYGMSQIEITVPLTTVYILSMPGSVAGGWLSGYFLRKGWPLYKARRVALLLFALMMLPMVFAQAVGQMNYWYAILIIGFATAGHQAWSATNLTTVSDMFPGKAVGSIVGIGGMIGAVGGVILSRTAGVILEYYSQLNQIQTGYYILFIICALSYVVSWLLFSLLVPKMDRVSFS
ncbi:MAG: MFS transporter [Bacteroidota bacterium]